MIERYYKAFTHDLRSPLQGGNPVWDGKLPYILPEVPVDTGPKECSEGWNATRSVADCLRIAGFWREPWPMRVFSVDPNGHELIERGDKVRSATWNIASECALAETEAAIYQVSEKWFASSKLQSEMGREQFLWYKAFASDVHDESAVMKNLSKALEARGLRWSLKKYGAALAAWAARAALDAWDAWAARAARDARDAWAARAARDAWDAWDAWAARAAWASWDALTVCFSGLMKWTSHDPQLLTTGIRDAYANGLLLAIPTAKDELGYVMKGGKA